MTRTVLGSGSKHPTWPWGFFPRFAPPPMRSATASQRDAGQTSCTPPVSSHGDHTPSATQTSGALHTAYGKGPSLECDPARTPSPPLNEWSRLRSIPYMLMFLHRWTLSVFQTDHLKDEAPPDECHADPSGRSESIQDALVRLARFSGAVNTTTSSGKYSRSVSQRAVGRPNQTISHTHTLSEWSCPGRFIRDGTSLPLRPFLWQSSLPLNQGFTAIIRGIWILNTSLNGLPPSRWKKPLCAHRPPCRSLSSSEKTLSHWEETAIRCVEVVSVLDSFWADWSQPSLSPTQMRVPHDLRTGRLRGIKTREISRVFST